MYISDFSKQYHLILLHLNTNYFDHIDQLQMLTRAHTVDINYINKFLSFINIDVNPWFKKWQLNIINFFILLLFACHFMMIAWIYMKIGHCDDDDQIGLCLHTKGYVDWKIVKYCLRLWLLCKFRPSDLLKSIVLR